MDYIKVMNYRLQVVNNHQISSMDMPLITYINRRLRPYLTTTTTQEKILKKIFGFKNKSPIIINHQCLLICIRSHRNPQALYINYYKISSWEKIGKAVLITFINDHVMKLESHQKFINQIKKINQILANRNKIKIINQ